MNKIEKTELPIIKAAYDLTAYLIPLVEKMPRTHKFVLGDRIYQTALDLVEGFTMARYMRHKTGKLREMNLLLERLRIFLRLAKDIKAINIKSYGYVTAMIDNVGRMLGGWISHSEHSEKKR